MKITSNKIFHDDFFQLNSVNELGIAIHYYKIHLNKDIILSFFFKKKQM